MVGMLCRAGAGPERQTNDKTCVLDYY